MTETGKSPEQQPSLGEQVLTKARQALIELAKLVEQEAVVSNQLPAEENVAQEVRRFVAENANMLGRIVDIPRPVALDAAANYAVRAHIRHDLLIGMHDLQLRQRTDEITTMLQGQILTVTSPLGGFMNGSQDGLEPLPDVLQSVTAPFLGLDIGEGSLFLGEPEQYYKVFMFDTISGTDAAEGMQPTTLVSIEVTPAA